MQANRVRRLGIPILTSHVLVEAVPNADHTGITGAIIAECENFKPIPGTERLIDGIDCINICTGRVRELQAHSQYRKAHRRNRLHQHLYRAYA